MTALNCIPIIETANAKVTVDSSTSVVQEHTLTTSPQTSSSAWTDYWVMHVNSSDWNYTGIDPATGETTTPEYINMTVS